MNSLGTDFIIGLAFFLVIEGLAYALAPGFIKTAARYIPEVPEEQLRVFGVVALGLGVLLVWLVRG